MTKLKGINVFETTKDNLDKLKSKIHYTKGDKLNNSELIDLLITEYEKLDNDKAKK